MALLQQIQLQLQDPTIPWQPLVIGLGIGVTVFEGWIGSRQKPFLSSILHPAIPPSLVPYLSPSTASLHTYHKSQKYALDKLTFGGYLSLLDHFETFLLLTGATAGIWSKLGLGRVESSWIGFGKGGSSSSSNWTLLKGLWDLSAKLPFAAGGEIRHSMAFLLVLTTLGSVLSVPKEYYKNFVLEEKHGFNKTTRSTFVGDQIKGYLLSVALQTPILAGMLWIIQWVGADGMLTVVSWMLLFIFAFQLLLIPIYPYLIAPLFNTYTPLPADSPVFPLVKELATKLDFPLGKIWVMDGSKRSAHSNAFFFGLPFLTKHIVIYDTLLEKSTPEEVQAILAHELGHWKGQHILILLATSLLQTGFSLCTFTLFLNNAPLLHAFGFPSSSSSSAGPTLISLLLAANLFTPMSAVLHFVTNSVTRALEYNADAFATKLGSGYAKNLKGALVRIHEENLGIYGVDWIYSAYNNNHPTLVERLEALDKSIEKAGEKTK